jgi:S1-C subfamily serine protease
MPSLSNWTVPRSAQPKPEDYDYDLERALASVVAVRSTIPEDAFSAETLGTERLGNGVLIRDGIVLTIGYLITEADSIWLTFGDGRVVQGHALGYDQATGFGLVQALARLDVPALPLGQSGKARVGDKVVVAGAGGRSHSLSAQIAAKQEFAGYWEYLLEEAIFTAPAHPHWGGTAVIDGAGHLIGIGSLHLEQDKESGRAQDLNMVVPIDLLPPILDDLLTTGRANRPPRPWLGVYATEVEDKVIIVGVAGRGPAKRTDLRTGDVVLAIAGEEVSDLAAFYRRLWSLGAPGIEVPLLIYREGKTFELRVPSTERSRVLKPPRLH